MAVYEDDNIRIIINELVISPVQGVFVAPVSGEDHTSPVLQK